MTKHFYNYVRLLFFAGMTTALVDSATADMIWTSMDDSLFISVEYANSNFKENTQLVWPSYAVFATMRAHLDLGPAFIVELPYAKSTSNGPFPPGSNLFKSGQAAFGNFYGGIQTRLKNNLLWEIGCRLPTASDDHIRSNLSGILADYDRIDAFIADWMSIRVIANYVPRLDRFSMRTRIGLSHFFNISKNDPAPDKEAHLLYSAHLWHNVENFHFGVGASGVRDLSRSDSEGQYGFMAAYTYEFVKATVFLRFPLTKALNRENDYVSGFSVQITRQPRGKP
jgi:hypothetical protein